MMLPHIMPCPIVSQIANVNPKCEYEPKTMNPEMNVTTAGHLQANETSQHVKTCHVRHIFIPIDQTIKKYFPSHNNLLNATIQSHPIKINRK